MIDIECVYIPIQTISNHIDLVDFQMDAGVGALYLKGQVLPCTRIPQYACECKMSLLQPYGQTTFSFLPSCKQTHPPHTHANTHFVNPLPFSISFLVCDCLTSEVGDLPQVTRWFTREERLWKSPAFSSLPHSTTQGRWSTHAHSYCKHIHVNINFFEGALSSLCFFWNKVEMCWKRMITDAPLYIKDFVLV